MHVFIDTPFSILVNVQVYIRGTVLKRYNMYNRSSLTFSGEKYIRNMILLEWKQLLMIIITKSIFYTSIDFESLNKLIPIFFMSVFPFFSFFFFYAAITLLYCKEDEEVSSMRNEEELQELTIIGEVCWNFCKVRNLTNKLLFFGTIQLASFFNRRRSFNRNERSSS